MRTSLDEYRRQKSQADYNENMQYKLKKEAQMDKEVFNDITKSPKELIKEIEKEIQIDNITLKHIENFAKEIKEGFQRIAIGGDYFTADLADILCKFIDEHTKLYKNYFDFYCRKMEEYYKKEGENK